MSLDPIDLAALQSMPAAMRALPQWLLWRFMANEGGKKPRKVPYYVSGRTRVGEQGGVTDRGELTTFDIALTHLARGHYDGLGFAFLPGDGLIGIDIDGAIDADGVVSGRCEAIIAACDSYTELSPSGKGVHIIVSGETTTFKDNRIGLEVFCGRQFFTCTGRTWVGTPAQVNPLDVSVLRRLQATVAGARKGAATVPAVEATPGVRTFAPQTTTDLTRKLELALNEISPDMDHDQWVVVGMALKHALGDAGLALWGYWSSKAGNVASEEVLRSKWASFKGGSGRGTATEATIFKMAMDRGWKPPKAPRAAAVRRASNEATAAQGVETKPTPNASSAEMDAAFVPLDELMADLRTGDGDESDQGDDGERWRRALLKNSDGSKKDCRENVFMFLSEHPRLKGVVAFDEFSYRILKLRSPPWKSPPGEWATSDDFELGLWLAQTAGVRLTVKSEGTLAAGVAMAANRAKFHPVRDYLAATTWDGIPRLAHWLHECLGTADTPYTSLVGRWFALGMVNRILNPGCQMDNMIVLEGAQGKLKSSALRVLAGEWFADTPIKIGEKDALLNLAGVWLYEVAELDAFNKAEVTAVKQYVSSRVDRVREPYSRRPVDRQRSCVLGGTTNQHEYFKDSTGSRRFWPLACDGDIDLKKLAEWRDQMFAEAVAALASGERYHPSREESEQFVVPEQESREITDPWYERIAIWLICEDQKLEKSYTSSQILTGALSVPADRIDGARQMATRVGIVMRKLAWLKVRDATGARLWRYMRPEEESPEPGHAQPLLGSAAAEVGDGVESQEWSANEWEGAQHAA